MGLVGEEGEVGGGHGNSRRSSRSRILIVTTQVTVAVVTVAGNLQIFSPKLEGKKYKKPLKPYKWGFFYY